MAKILVKCIEEVVHGSYNLAVGQLAMMDSCLAKELERFVTPENTDDDDEKKREADGLNKMMPEGGWKDKAEADDAQLKVASESPAAPDTSTAQAGPAGSDLTLGNELHLPVANLASEQVTSSASPAAQASQPTTAVQPKTGATKKKGGR